MSTMLFKATIRDDSGVVRTCAMVDVTDHTREFPRRKCLTWDNVVRWVVARDDVFEVAIASDQVDATTASTYEDSYASNILDELVVSRGVWRLMRIIAADGTMSLAVTCDPMHARGVIKATLPPELTYLTHVIRMSIRRPSDIMLNVSTLIEAGVSERDVIAVAGDAGLIIDVVTDLRVVVMPADAVLADRRHRNL
jgi:hypothetical protein